MDYDGELLRCRERLHDLESEVNALKLWQPYTEKRVADCTARVDELVTANKIAAALHARGGQLFTGAQKMAALLVSVCAVAGFILQLPGVR